MGKNKNRKKIIKYPRFSILHLNIPTILFGALFIYMVICLVLYMTTSHVTAYEVTAGSLFGNQHYTAIVLKSETLVTAPQSGNVTYFAREGSKTGNGNAVCSIQEGKRSTILDKTNTDSAKEDTATSETKQINAAAITQFKSTMSAFSSNYNSSNFQNVYNFEADLETRILELASESAENGIYSNLSSEGLTNVCTAPSEGIVVYAEDGYEAKTYKDLTPEDFNQQNYIKQNLRLNETVKTGDSIYKLITDENWQLVIPLDKKTFAKLSGEETVRFMFLKDNTTFNGDFMTFQNGTNYYGVLEINHSVIRFSEDRFVEIQLLLNQNSGLKIPNTAITERVFFKIPKEYVTYNEDSPNELVLTKEIKTKEGTEVKNIIATVFDITENDFLVDASLFKKGDVLQLKETQKKYNISETTTMQGVYNINKGYSIFREIKIIDENEEYCIVEEGSSFGLSQYDYIVLDASTVKDEQIVY